MRSLQKINTVFALVAINTLVCGNALSQTKVDTISSILDNPVEGQEVTLRGKIIEHEQGQPDYILTDGTSKITIELEDHNYLYDPDTTVEVSGIIDFESQDLEEAKQDPTPEDIQLDVNQLQVVTSN